MAARRKAQPKKFKFELTRNAIAGIGVVVFCLFLWMFLFGVWAGQSLLKPGVLAVDNTTIAEKTVTPQPLFIQAKETKRKR